ncbi:hypothetical protein HDV02_004184 [Globomyces sp. JEL0801]|nr:hypothetical protein HDV02_004184 [Globomyces sp. JEL0801]
MGRKNKNAPPPVDDPNLQNTTAFRILERKLKRKGALDQSLFEILTDYQEILIFNDIKKAYKFANYPGLYLIKNAIPVELQKKIIVSCLKDWTQPPNVSNLDSHFQLDPKGIWNLYVEHKDDLENAPLVKKRFRSEFKVDQYEEKENNGLTEQLAESAKNMLQCPTVTKVSEKCSKSSSVSCQSVNSCSTTTKSTNSCSMNNSLNTCSSQSEAVQNMIVPKLIDPVSSLIIDAPVDNMLKQEDELIVKVLHRMRWSTLGHQYNWTKKEYHFDRVPPFPKFMSDVSYDIVQAVQPLTGYSADKWKPEAGIINFYQPGDTLTAHQDRSEINTEAPLLSLCFGLDCGFLFGTEDRGDKPMAVRLESGDIIIMSNQARRAFHGVPRIIEDS